MFCNQGERERDRERERRERERERENIMTFLTPFIINPYQPATKVSFPLTSSNHLQIHSELWISRLRQVAPATLPPPVGVDSSCRAVTKKHLWNHQGLGGFKPEMPLPIFLGTIKIQILPWSWQWLLLLRTIVTSIKKHPLLSDFDQGEHFTSKYKPMPTNANPN